MATGWRSVGVALAKTLAVVSASALGVYLVVHAQRGANRAAPADEAPSTPASVAVEPPPEADPGFLSSSKSGEPGVPLEAVDPAFLFGSKSMVLDAPQVQEQPARPSDEEIFLSTSKSLAPAHLLPVPAPQQAPKQPDQR